MNPGDARSSDLHALPFVAVLERDFALIRSECEQLDPEADFIPWPEHAAYSGVWRVFPLFFPSGPYLPVDVERNRTRCPETSRILRSLPTLEGAGFSFLGGRTRVVLHTDHYAPGVVRCHLALRVPAGARMVLEGRELFWEEGRCLVFDGQGVHEAINDSDEPRVVLLADFRTQSGPA